jgi:hypothetical protein
MKGFWKKHTAHRRKITLEALEERVVFDAAVDPVPESGPFIISELTSSVLHQQNTFLGISPELYQGPTASVEVMSATGASAASDPISRVFDHGLSVVLIANDLEDAAGIAAAAAPDAKVVYFDAQNDDLTVVNQRLDQVVAESGGQKIANLAVATHGDANRVAIGVDSLSLENAAAHKTDLQALGAKMIPGGQIQLYSCSLAADDAGRALVSSIGAFTGAKVFASTDMTGAAPYNWNLEFASSAAVPAALFDPAALEQVRGHLAQQAVTTLAALDARIDGFNDAGPGSHSLPLAGANPAFSAYDETAGHEVFSANGLTSGSGQTQRTALASVNPHIQDLTVMGGNVYFSAHIDDPTGTELAVATGAGQTAVSDFGNGWFSYDPDIQQVVAGTGRVYFVGHQPANIVAGVAAGGYEAWRTNGGAPTPGANVTDGTGAAGNITNFIGLNGYTDGNLDISQLTVAGNGTTVYLVGNSPGTTGNEGLTLQGYEVWRSDGATPLGGDVTDNQANGGVAGGERGAVSAFANTDNAATLINRYNPNIQNLTATKDGSTTLYFSANDVDLGVEIWRTDGAQPVTNGGFGHRTENVNNVGLNTNVGNITNFNTPDVDIRGITSVPDAGAKTIFFVSDAVGGYEVWRSNGGVPLAADQTDVGGARTAFTLSDPSISQLTPLGANLYFVANNGANGGANPAYFELWQINGGTNVLTPVTQFNDTPIPAPTLPAGVEQYDPLRNPIPEHQNPDIRLVTTATIGGSNYVYFEANSVDNLSRELYRADVTNIAAGTTGTHPTQLTNFGYADPQIELLTFSGTTPVFVAQNVANGQEIFTIANDVPVNRVVNATVQGDLDLLGTPISFPNALRTYDPDSGDQLTVTITPTAGISALNFTAPVGGGVTATQAGNTWTLSPTAGVTFDPWTYQRNLNATLASMTATLNNMNPGTVGTMTIATTDGLLTDTDTLTVTVTDYDFPTGFWGRAPRLG